jgi:hypothetical protein
MKRHCSSNCYVEVSESLGLDSVRPEAKMLIDAALDCILKVKTAYKQ